METRALDDQDSLQELVLFWGETLVMPLLGTAML
jgi:hypothetical protein